VSGLSISRIVLAAHAAHAIGRNELGGNEPHGVAMASAQWWPPEQASMATVHGGNEAISSCSLARATLGRTRAGLPA
jgi:hypothetical protein